VIQISDKELRQISFGLARKKLQQISYRLATD